MLLRLLCIPILALGLLTGCGDDAEEPEPLPPVTSSPSVSSTPSVPTVPTQAAAETPEAAAEFARFWFATLNEAARTGDTTHLRAISTDNCPACERFANSIEELYEADGRIEGGVFSIVAAEAPALPDDAMSASVTVIYDVSPTRQIGADGEVLASTPALTGVDGDMRLERVGDAWRTADLVTA